MIESAQRSLRRFVGWVWHTNHDDQVPTVIHGVLVSAMIIAVPFAAESVLSALGIIALVAALAVGTAFADEDSVNDVPAASVVSSDRDVPSQRCAGSPATVANLTSPRVYSKVYGRGAEVETEEKV